MIINNEVIYLKAIDAGGDVIDVRTPASDDLHVCGCACCVWMSVLCVGVRVVCGGMECMCVCVCVCDDDDVILVNDDSNCYVIMVILIITLLIRCNTHHTQS